MNGKKKDRGNVHATVDLSSQTKDRGNIAVIIDYFDPYNSKFSLEGENYENYKDERSKHGTKHCQMMTERYGFY